MKETIHKYQQEYEKSKGCFWSRSPAKFVSIFADLPASNLSNLNILDLGAGEGKNAVFLANRLDSDIIAVDTSKIALSRFKLQPNYNACKNRITVINDDIRNLSFMNQQFDVIVAYGILHCLDSKREIQLMIKNIRKWLKKDGYFICATFTDKIAVPEIQPYLTKNSFLHEGDLESILDGFSIIKSENSIITEIHPTSNIEHNHSIVRIIARKNA